MAKAKPKAKGNKTVLYLLIAAAAVVAFLWYRHRQAANAAMPTYVATPQTSDNPYAPYYGSSSSGGGFTPSSPYGGNTGATATTPVAVPPIEIGNGGQPLTPLPSRLGVGAHGPAS